MAEPEVQIRSLASLSEETREAAARLVMAADPTYYEVSGVDVAAITEGVERGLGAPRGVCPQGFLAVAEGALLGVLAYLPAADLPRARMTEAQHLMRALSKEGKVAFRDHLRAQGDGFGPVPEESIYLSRIAVEPEARGRGVGRALVTALAAIASGPPAVPCSLHVRRENEGARALYERLGYQIIEEEMARPYLTLVRPAVALGAPPA